MTIARPNVIRPDARAPRLRRSGRALSANAALACLCLSAASCGTIINGTQQAVFVDTHPPGAIISANGMRLGLTPCNVLLDRDQDYVLLIQAPGHEDQSVLLTRKLSAWILLDILFWPTFIVDFVAGGAFRFSDERVSVVLRPKGSVDASDATHGDGRAMGVPEFLDVLVSRGVISGSQRETYEKRLAGLAIGE